MILSLAALRTGEGSDRARAFLVGRGGGLAAIVVVAAGVGFAAGAAFTAVVVGVTGSSQRGRSAGARVHM